MIAAQVRPGGLVSLICPNPCGDVLDAAIRMADPTQALEMLSAKTRDSVTFGAATTRIEADQVAGLLTDHQIEIKERYGILSVTTYIADNDRKHDPAFYAALEALEVALCDRKPYSDTARFWQLVGRKAV